MASLTLTHLDDDLLRRLTAEAERRKLPVEEVAGEWLKRGAAATPRLEIPEITETDRKALLAMGGTWTKEEADEFDKAIEIFEQIDEELWK